MFKVSVLDIKTASPILEEMASSVILPGEEEEFSILDFHQPLISCLKEGMIKIDDTPMAIKRGIAKMQEDKLVILVEK